MADKKPDKKAAAPAEKRSLELIIAEVIIIIVLLSGCYFALTTWLGISAPDGSGNLTTTFVDSFKRFMIGLLSSVQAISVFVSLLFIMGIIFAKFKTGQVERMRAIKVKVEEAKQKKTETAAKAENKRWKTVLEHASSSVPSDRRLAVLEADILLGDLLTKLGYQGESIGEQLKAVDKNDFRSINLAWEAHKIRNSIAHEGSEFAFSPNEAKRVIGMFEEVFRELNYI
jgi:hypothetical protein